MNRTRLVAACAAAGLIVAAPPAAQAQAGSDPRVHRLEILAARAPLAVSGDGAWRLHVDAHDVLHRVSLADPTRESTAPLPPGVQALAASADGRRVAVSTNRECTGLVEFGAQDGDVATVAWRPVQMARDGTPLGPLAGPWVAQMPADCGAHEPAPPVAISADGRWVATPDVVVDARTNQVVATLPSDDALPLRLQFIDHDTRLLIARVHLGKRAEGAPASSRLSFSVWDLASKALINAVDVAGSDLATRAGLLVDVSAQTGALLFLDERARQPDHALALTQLAPDTCGAAPRVRSSVSDAVGPSLAVDPYGRWIAWARPLEARRSPAEWDAGLRSELIVQDLAGGRLLARATSRFVLAGVVATPDGRSVFALGAHAIDATTGAAADAPAPVPDTDQLVRIDMGDAIASLPRDAPGVPAAGPCREPGEAPGSRAQARTEHLLAPLWSHDLDADAGAASSDASACHGGSTGRVVFRGADGGFWYDAGERVERFDLATGAIAQTLPTPRRVKVCSIVSPTGTGFFSVSGDTLTWRPLAAATDPARRRVVERRPGWVATLAPVRADAVRVVWQATEATLQARAAAGEPRGVLVADYDANGKRQREFSMATLDARNIDLLEGDAEGNVQVRQPRAPCHDATGAPIAIGYDWRAGPFGSWRGLTCGPLAGASRLIWWSGATIAPRTPDDATSDARSALDGAIGVVADRARIHVVNLALQREFAQIALPGRSTERTWVLASRRLVLVQATAADGHAWLHAYALP